MKEIEHAITHLSNVGINTKGFILNGDVTTSSQYDYGYRDKSGYGDLNYSYKG